MSSVGGSIPVVPVWRRLQAGVCMSVHSYKSLMVNWLAGRVILIKVTSPYVNLTSPATESQHPKFLPASRAGKFHRSKATVTHLGPAVICTALNIFNIHTPPVEHFFQIFNRGCMNCKLSSLLWVGALIASCVRLRPCYS